MKFRIIKRPTYDFVITPQGTKKELTHSYIIQSKRWFSPFWIVKRHCTSLEDAEYCLRSIIEIAEMYKAAKKMKRQTIKSVKI